MALTREFVEAVSQFGFEYGRFLLLKRERDLLSQFIEKQGELDAELQERFNAYATKVLEKQEEFENIISHAFDPDIMKRFKTSVNIAKIVGVDDEEILDSVSKTDDFERHLNKYNVIRLDIRSYISSNEDPMKIRENVTSDCKNCKIGT